MNDPLDPLLVSLRTQSPPHAERVALALETRVLARLRDQHTLAALWFKRWSVAFGLGTAACVALLVTNLLSLSASGLEAALAGDWLLTPWL